MRMLYNLLICICYICVELRPLSFIVVFISMCFSVMFLVPCCRENEYMFYSFHRHGGFVGPGPPGPSFYSKFLSFAYVMLKKIKCGSRVMGCSCVVITR